MSTLPFTFSELLKSIRKVAGVNQQEMADILGVSKVLIGMIESDMKEPSKKFIINLAEKLSVHPSALMPFVAFGQSAEDDSLSALEKKLIKIGVKLQNTLIQKQAKKLPQYAKLPTT